MRSISLVIVSLLVGISGVDVPASGQPSEVVLRGNLKGSSTSSTMDVSKAAPRDSSKILLSDDSCTMEVRSKYRWARWVIMIGVAFLFALFILPLVFCTSCLSGAGRFTMLGALLLLLTVWLVFAILADNSIYGAFDYVFRSVICE